MGANIKGQPRAFYKYTTKYNHDARLITDWLRHTFVFRTFPEIIAAFGILCDSEKCEVVNIKNRFLKIGITGYADILLNVRLERKLESGEKDYTICEIQLHHEKIEKIKHVQHALYKAIRFYVPGF